MKNVYIVIDMQNDFLTMALGSENCKKTIPNIKKVLQESIKKDDVVIFTYDTHYADTYKNTLEGKNIPIHCVTNTIGHELDKEIQEEKDRLEKTNRVISITKETFGSDILFKYLNENSNKIENIYIMGVCTSICVHANAVIARTACKDSQVYVIENCVGDFDIENHIATLKSLKPLQIEII